MRNPLEGRVTITGGYDRKALALEIRRTSRTILASSSTTRIGPSLRDEPVMRAIVRRPA